MDNFSGQFSVHDGQFEDAEEDTSEVPKLLTNYSANEAPGKAIEPPNEGQNGHASDHVKSTSSNSDSEDEDFEEWDWEDETGDFTKRYNASRSEVNVTNASGKRQSTFATEREIS